MSRLSLIVGSAGQDGTILRAQLTQKGTAWIGTDVESIDSYGVQPASFSSSVDVNNPEHVDKIVKDFKPCQIYYLAAHHHGSSAHAQMLSLYYKSGLSVNVLGPLHFLESITRHSPQSRLLYVSSSLVYAPLNSPNERITEESPMAPAEIYAMEKTIASHYCRQYRNKFNVYASIAIPFNHESEFRRPGFFTRDATDAIAEICFGQRQYWEAGNLETIVDWTHASDIVTAFQDILSLDKPGDYIISSGHGHTTGEFVKIACEYAGVNFNKSIRINPDKVHRSNHCRIGDASKLKAVTGWQPTVSFKVLVEYLMQAAFDRINNKQKGRV